MWETIGPFGEPLTGPGLEPSWNHGWSSGAAPALSTFVLGVSPLTPGYATVLVEPRLGGLGWARGTVPTPRGRVAVEWRKRGRTTTLTVTTPVAARLTLPVAGRATLNGKRVAPQVGKTSVPVRAGKHVLVVAS
jgi:hypothetical protein